MPEDGFDGELQAWYSLGCQRLATPGPLDRSLRFMSGLGVDFDGHFGQADELDPIIGRSNPCLGHPIELKNVGVTLLDLYQHSSSPGSWPDVCDLAYPNVERLLRSFCQSCCGFGSYAIVSGDGALR
jgi:hypothetical protein